ncbi:MAG: DUF4920 domain-containing protein [Chitinophagales bacterium]|nr:DUF4920 domain-containing protein [Chitinophagales bacterium]MBP9550046.1 DUF4920 domain-containing protein [Chitinophagales bacterium]
MKKIIYSFLITALIAFTACSDKKEKDHSEDEMDQMSGAEETEDILVVNGVGGYGVEINGDDAKDLMVFASDRTAANGYTGKVKGTVTSVCQNKGCWMKLDLGNGESMRVSFKDYGFFVPKDLEGKQVIVQGVAEVKTISVEDQRHFAEDAGKTEEQIQSITEPQEELVFVADGVIVL